MVKLISFNSSKFSPKLTKDKVLSFIPVIMVKDDWVPKMNGIR
jgi:hypothetical protein